MICIAKSLGWIHQNFNFLVGRAIARAALLVLGMSNILFIGLSLSSILLLIALGLSITYGAMGVINMVHGEL